MSDLIILWIIELVVLFSVTYLLYKKYPHKHILYIPSGVVFVLGVAMFVLSFVIGGFEGMWLGVLSIGSGIVSLVMFFVAVFLSFAGMKIES